ncbi:hypothetical protein [Nocardioides ochotonae]|uniref:hypothetical protein n=1 Tax=Nocardioides ochotonae TaxID=2685869 RepID=UPI001A9F15CC|nr:hypothetical protein [Nocardioides ochotonae]
MLKKLPLLIAAGAGYVLGARAGRERYEQIKAQAQKIGGDPRVQQAAQQAQDVVSTQASAAAGVAKEKAGSAAHAAADKVRSHDQSPGQTQTSVPPAP